MNGTAPKDTAPNVKPTAWDHTATPEVNPKQGEFSQPTRILYSPYTGYTVAYDSLSASRTPANSQL